MRVLGLGSPRGRAGADGGNDRPNRSADPNRNLAHEIKRLREAGVEWDGPDGACARVGIKRAQAAGSSATPGSVT